jgi:hypothetical protein
MSKKCSNIDVLQAQDTETGISTKDSMDKVEMNFNGKSFPKTSALQKSLVNLRRIQRKSTHVSNQNVYKPS